MENPIADTPQSFNCSLFAEAAKVCGDGFCVPSTGACDCTYTYVRSGERCNDSSYAVYGAPIYAYQYVYDCVELVPFGISAVSHVPFELLAFTGLKFHFMHFGNLIKVSL